MKRKEDPQPLSISQPANLDIVSDFAKRLPMKDHPQTVICRYQLKPGAEPEMLRLIARHWPTLHRAGLVTDEPPRVFRGLPGKSGAGRGTQPRVLVEVFDWKSAASAEVAHRSPEVMAIWEPMGALCEAMEFPHFERIAVDFRR